MRYQDVLTFARSRSDEVLPCDRKTEPQMSPCEVISGSGVGDEEDFLTLATDSILEKLGGSNGTLLLERLVFRLGLVSMVRRDRSDFFKLRKLGLYLSCSSKLWAADILNERYARGEVALDEYKEMKSEIAKAYSNGGDAGTHSGR